MLTDCSARVRANPLESRSPRFGFFSFFVISFSFLAFSGFS